MNKLCIVSALLTFTVVSNVHSLRANNNRISALHKPWEMNRMVLSIRIEKEDFESFYSIFESIGKQSGLCFVAENEPLHLRRSKEEIEQILAKEKPLDETIEQIAGLYDYSTEKHGRIILLKKKFTDPEDIPDITPGEYLHSLQDVMRLCRLFTTTNRPYTETDLPLTQDFIRSLSPEQLKRAGAAMYGASVTFPLPIYDGLAIASLNANQKAIYHQLIVNDALLKPVDEFLWATGEAEIICNDRTAFLRETQFGNTFFGYGLPDEKGLYAGQDSKGKDKLFRPLSPPALINGPGSSPRFIDFGSTVRHIAYVSQRDKSGNVINATKDPTEPRKEENKTKNEEEDSKRITLSELVITLGKRSKAPDANFDPGKVSLEKAFEEKRVTIINGDSLPPTSVLSAAAEVYGLRYLESKEGDITITYRPIPRPRALNDLWAALKIALPEPFVRQIHDTDAFHGIEDRTPARFRPSHPSPPTEYQTGEAIRLSAIRRIRTLVEPLINKNENKMLLLKESPRDVNMALADALLTEVWEVSGFLFGDECPWELTHFDEMYLVGGSYERGGEKLFQIIPCMPIRNGTKLEQIGGGQNISYPPASNKTPER